MTDLALPGWRGGDGNAAYLDKTLRFGPVEEWLADDVAFGVLWRLFKRALAVSLLVLLPFLPFILADLGRSGAFDPYSESGSSDDGGAAGVGIVLSQLAFWGVLLFSRLLEPVAEWRVLLADRSDRVEAVYRQITATLYDRKLPIHWEARRVKTDLGARNVSNRLILTDRPCTAIVSVFGYGTSLYLGWTMWRSRRGYGLFGRFVADLVLGLAGQNAPEQLMLRTERLRAMREAVHAGCREGLVVAVEGRDVADWVGFPGGLPPVEDERRPPGPRPSAPRPGGSALSQASGWHTRQAPPPPSPPSPPPPPPDPGWRPSGNRP